MNRLRGQFIWNTLCFVLDLNARWFGVGSSHELCRDIKARYAQKGFGTKAHSEQQEG